MKVSEMDKEYFTSKIEELLEKEYDDGTVDYWSLKGDKLFIEGILDANTLYSLGMYMRKLERLS